MNQVLNALATDLAAIKQKEKELAKSGQSFQFSRMEPYIPSEEVLKFNQTQAEYHKKVKDLNFGQY
jgi:hypothetical protein